MQKTILVTGGLGYIGSHTIVELLNLNYKVICIDNLYNSNIIVKSFIEKITSKSFDFYNIDINDKQLLEDCLLNYSVIDSVIHFAAYKSVEESVLDPLKYYHNNINGLLNIIKAVEKFNSNLIFSSSCTIYGEPVSLPVTENSRIVHPTSPYGNTKKICEEILVDYSKTSTNKITSLRYFNPVGAHPSGMIGELPNGTPQNLLPYLMQTAIGKREILTIHGNDYPTNDGTCIRDYIHVVDLALAHVAAIDYMLNESTNKYSVFNIGTGYGISVKELIDQFEQLTKVKVKYQYGKRRAGDIVQIWACADKAKTELGWEAKYKTSDILLSAWQWEQNLKKTKL